MFANRRPAWLQALVSRPRLLAALAIGLACYLLITPFLTLSKLERGLVAWNVAGASYLILITRLMLSSNPADMHRRALDQDSGRKTVLTLAISSVAISFIGIVVELVEARSMLGQLKAGHAALALSTVVISWTFAHVMFAQHYAHEYYEAVLAGQSGGIVFPGETSPEYGDFLYLSFTLGTSAQTSDVSFTSRPMRRLGTVHSVFSFAFNTALIALGINIASGLV
jgi:uncharacterized membrane protein